MALGNRLVGNPEGAAVLEALLGSLTLVVSAPCVVAVTGAAVDVSVNGRAVGQNVAVALVAGDVFDIAMPTEGLRVYVAVRGGVGGPTVLGSRSYDTLGRIGRAPLASGDDIISAHMDCPEPPWFEPVPVARLAQPAMLDLDRGPRRDWITDDAAHTLVTTTWTVASSIDRTGVRLIGPALDRPEHLVGIELPSEAMIPGAVQVPTDGQPIILGPDCGTTGGYPVVAVVTRSSLNSVGQLRPGNTVRFRLELARPRTIGPCLSPEPTSPAP